MRPQENQRGSGLDWGAADIRFARSPEADWGIAPDSLAMANQLLHTPGHGAVTSRQAPGNLTFAQFERLVNLLYPHGELNMDINEAIRFRYSELVRERDDPAYAKALQEALHALLSSSETSLPTDGVWTEPHEEALRAVAEAYNLLDATRNEHLLSVLTAVANRLPRWSCTDPALRRQLGYHPFFKMDDGAADFELAQADADLILRHPASQEALVRFHGAANGQLPDTFNQFTAWLALLYLKPAKPRNMGTIDLRVGTGEWQPLDALDTRDTEQFVAPATYCLHVNETSVKLHARIRPFLTSALELVAVWFNADFSFAISKGYPMESEGREIAQYFDSEYFFRDFQTSEPNTVSIAASKKATYVKIFVLNRDFPSNANEERYRPLAGTDADASFYRLLTASEADIHQAFTIGLSYATPVPFNGRWVLLAGTGDRELHDTERWMAEALAAELAKQGYGLMVGGWPGVDEAATHVFAACLADMGISDKNRIRQVLETNQVVRYALGELERLSSNWLSFTNSWYAEAVKRADAVVLIGGTAGTERVHKAANKVGVPVVPIPATGGVAKRAFDALASGKEPASLPEAIAQEITDTASATRVAEALVEYLDRQLPQKSGKGDGLYSVLRGSALK